MALLPSTLESISNAHIVDPGRMNRIFAQAKILQDLLNGEQTIQLHPKHVGHAYSPTGSGWFPRDDRLSMLAVTGAPTSHDYYIPSEKLPVGRRIVSWSVVANQFGTGQMLFVLFKIDLNDGTQTQIGSGVQPSAAAQDGLIYSETVNEVTAADFAYYVKCQSGQATDEIRDVKVVLDYNTTSVVPPLLAEGDNLSAANLNALQDAIIDIHNKSYGTFDHTIGIGHHSVFDYASDPPVIHPSFAFWNAGVAGAARIITAGIGMRLGDQIKSWDLLLLEGASLTVSGKLWKVDFTDGTRTQVGSTQTSGTGGGNVSVGDSGLIEDQVAAVAYHLEGTFNGTGDATRRIYGFRYTIARNRS